MDENNAANILVVDDEVALLSLLNAILSKNGYRVFCAESAEQALAVMENESINLLISDVIMPDMDGYDLAAIVQERFPNIKIQLASGFTGDDDKHTDNPLSEDLLEKPYSLSVLLERVQSLLQ